MELAQETETGLKVGVYRTDHGELKSGKVKDYFASRGTQHQFFAPHTSAHIGRVERYHRTLMGKARAMRSAYQLPPNRWDEFVLTAIYLTNHVPTYALDNKTPYEAYKGYKPSLSHLHRTHPKQTQSKNL